jgi:hypothetical protein
VQVAVPLRKIWRKWQANFHTALNHYCELGPQSGHEGPAGKAPPDAFLVAGHVSPLARHWHVINWTFIERFQSSDTLGHGLKPSPLCHGIRNDKCFFRDENSESEP